MSTLVNLDAYEGKISTGIVFGPENPPVPHTNLHTTHHSHPHTLSIYSFVISRHALCETKATFGTLEAMDPEPSVSNKLNA